MRLRHAQASRHALAETTLALESGVGRCRLPGGRAGHCQGRWIAPGKGKCSGNRDHGGKLPAWGLTVANVAGGNPWPDGQEARSLFRSESPATSAAGLGGKSREEVSGTGAVDKAAARVPVFWMPIGMQFWR